MSSQARPLFCSKGHRWGLFPTNPLPSDDQRLVCPRCRGLLRVAVPRDLARAERGQEKRGLVPAILIAVLLFPAIVFLTWLSVSRWRVSDLVVGPDGKTVAVARATIDGGRRIQVWDLAGGTELAKLGGEGQRIFGNSEDVIYAPVFTPDGNNLLVVRQEQAESSKPAGGGTRSAGAVLKWSFRAHAKPTSFKKHTEDIRTLEMDRTGKALLVSGWDQTVYCWQWPSGQDAGKLKHPADVHCQAVESGGKTLATGTLDGQLLLWDLAHPTQARSRGQAHTGLVKALAYDPTGAVLASIGGIDHTLKLWDAQTGKKKTEYIIDLDWLNCIVFAADKDGHRLALGGGRFGGGSEVQVWNIKDGKREGTYRVATNSVMCATFTRDGRSLLAGSGHATSIANWANQGRLYSWDLATGQEQPSLP
jgi:WD40 repeat protein